ncbi:MAG: PHB depolymerase family esterase [Pseudomonadota bacterium]
MRRVLRFIGFCLLGLVAVAAACAALLGYFVYTPDPEPPSLSGTLAKGSIEVGGLKRTYLSYVPRALAQGAPLIVVMHGSGENAAQIRTGTGYGFERLADQHGFAVVYPDSYTFDWNDCSVAGDYKVNGVNVDDVGFIGALVDKLIKETGADRGRVFATGVSAGGFMSMRLALESPARFRAVAAVSANVPAPENFKCKPAGPGTSVMIMNGTKDPLVPFAGGEVNLLGLFYKGGDVRSSRASGQYFADLNKIAGTPATQQATLAGDAGVEHVVWRNDAKTEVELVAIHGGGHGIPQPYWRRPRLLGPSPMTPDGPAMIWDFFQRQRP